MNQDIKHISHNGIFNFLNWLKRPYLLGVTMPTTIFPQGLVSLELKLTGWGWVKLEGTGSVEPRHWFFKNRNLTLFVPVGSHPILTIRNFWGAKNYQIDAESEREEVWIPHSHRFTFRLPDSVSTRIAAPALTSPIDVWRASEVNAPGNGHWRIHMPTGTIASLPTMPNPPNLVSQKFNDWRPMIPMNDLDHRIQQTSIDN